MIFFFFLFVITRLKNYISVRNLKCSQSINIRPLSIGVEETFPKCWFHVNTIVLAEQKFLDILHKVYHKFIYNSQKNKKFKRIVIIFVLLSFKVNILMVIVKITAFRVLYFSIYTIKTFLKQQFETKNYGQFKFILLLNKLIQFLIIIYRNIVNRNLLRIVFR